MDTNRRSDDLINADIALSQKRLVMFDLLFTKMHVERAPAATIARLDKNTSIERRNLAALEAELDTEDAAVTIKADKLEHDLELLHEELARINTAIQLKTDQLQILRPRGEESDMQNTSNFDINEDDNARVWDMMADRHKTYRDRYGVEPSAGSIAREVR